MHVMRAFWIDLLLATALIGAAVLLRGPRLDASGSWQLVHDRAAPAGVASVALRLGPDGYFDLAIEGRADPVWRRRGTWTAQPHGFELHPLPTGMSRIPGSRAAYRAAAKSDGTVVLDVEGRSFHLRRNVPAPGSR